MTTTERFATFIEIAQSWGDYVETLEKENKDLKFSRDFYKSRCELLEKVQKYMKDPERQIVCDILANNNLLPDPEGKRYGQDLLPLVKTSFFPKDLEDFYQKQMTKCTCSYLRIGTKISDTKNLNPDCPVHGTDSVWYNSPEQVKKRDERSQRLRELYDAARKARENQK